MLAHLEELARPGAARPDEQLLARAGGSPTPPSGTPARPRPSSEPGSRPWRGSMDGTTEGEYPLARRRQSGPLGGPAPEPATGRERPSEGAAMSRTDQGRPTPGAGGSVDVGRVRRVHPRDAGARPARVPSRRARGLHAGGGGLERGVGHPRSRRSACWSGRGRARTAGGEYFAGYLIEKSLSVDNIFVFALIFAYFAVPAGLPAPGAVLGRPRRARDARGLHRRRRRAARARSTG